MRRYSTLLKLLLGGIIAAAVLLLFYHCPFRFFFGVSCPGCGMTRALFSAVFSDFETAFYYHPMLPMLLPVGVYILLQRFCGMQVSNRRQNIYILLFAAVMILVYVVRLVTGDPVLQPDFENSFAAKISDLLAKLKN